MNRESNGKSADGTPTLFHFMGGRVSLDLTCTHGSDRGPGDERLTDPAQLRAWLTAAGLTSGRVDVSRTHLEQARRLRVAIGRAARAVIGEVPIARRDGRTMSAIAATPPLRPRLSTDGLRLTWDGDDKAAAALSSIARDALDLFTGPFRDRIRECEADDCGVLFVDTSRPGRRRWCSSEICGGRARATAYRARRGTVGG